MMTGVRASASRPSSTASRTISNAFAPVKKFWPVKLKMAISAIRRRVRTLSLRRGFGMRSSFADSVDRDSREDDCSLDGFLPVGVDANKSECRADGAEQSD